MPRRPPRVLYQNDTSVFGSVANVERVAIALAQIELGAVSPLERKLAVSIAQFFAGAILDGEEQRAEMARTILHQQATIERLTVDLQHLRRLLGE